MSEEQLKPEMKVAAEEPPAQASIAEQEQAETKLEAAAAADSVASHDNKNRQQVAPAEATENEGNDVGQFSDQQNIDFETSNKIAQPDVECERLLRNAQKQIKQMMAEAVARKFVHEESSSIISLCVAVDACLSHGLKRRALGLFKTNSSTALIQKVAKSCKSAQDILELVSSVEKQSEQNKKTSMANQQQQQRQQQQQDSPSSVLRATIGRKASNSYVHRRNMWIKYALIEKKLVDIVEYLAENSSNYYEPQALISNYLCSQILSSLLSGLNAIEFSRSKTSDCYQFDDPSADELLNRHKLANPIACLCSQRKMPISPAPSNKQKKQSIQNQLSRSATDGTKHVLGNSDANKAPELKRLTASQNSLDQAGSKQRRNPPNSSSSSLQSQPTTKSATTRTISAEQRTATNRPNSEQLGRSAGQVRRSPSPSQQQGKQPMLTKCATETGVTMRRRPLALKTSIARGTLITDCHHYSCQEISEHQQTKGYSFLCANSNGTIGASDGASNSANNSLQQQQNQQNSQQQDWSLWSPRMLHETLHQNSRSCLLYAKNNVLLVTQPNKTMAGYLSLHQTSSDLILKWIPNQMINGSHLNTQYCNEFPSASGQQSCERTVSPAAAGASTTATGDQQANSGNFSDNNNNNHSQRKDCTQVADGRGEQPMPIAVERSYLEYVTILSILRIVLLHCQFGQQAAATAKLDSTSLDHDHGQHSSTKGHSGTIAAAATAANDHDDDSAIATQSGPEETLILVEADGIQRAPFKFPKGGLRLFLSCLESGLRPNRYLDPAIKFDDGEWSDPLESPPPITAATTTDGAVSHTSTPSSTERERLSENSSSSLGLDSPSATSEPTRLDLLLKRLPSLKRHSPKPKLTSEPRTPTDTTTNQEQADHVLASAFAPQPSTPQLLEPQQPTTTTRNYVYRIVSFQQPDWPLQTPPHSALSVGSSSSGSFNLVNGQPTNQQQRQSGSSMQKFRWSLSKLAMFSARYTNSGGSTSSSVSNGGPLQTQTTNTNNSLSNTYNESDSLYDNSSLGRTISESADGDCVTRVTMEGGGGKSNSMKLARIDAKLNELKLSTSDDILALRTQSLQTLCESMRRQIVARAFYGWLAHCRRMRIIRVHLVKLIKEEEQCCLISETEEPELYEEVKSGLTREKWTQLIDCRDDWDEDDLCREANQLVYYGGIESGELRKEVWPYLLGHYKFKDNFRQRKARDESVRATYKACSEDWIKIERSVKQRDIEILAANISKASSRFKKQQQQTAKGLREAGEGEGGAGGEMVEAASGSGGNYGDGDDDGDAEKGGVSEKSISTEGQQQQQQQALDDDEGEGDDEVGYGDEANDVVVVDPELADESKPLRKVEKMDSMLGSKGERQPATGCRRRRARLESTGSVGSDASITDQFGNNVHRIDKDVQRCDRNFWYFKDTDNLEKLRNIMCSYVWQNLDVGYVQGMCDIAAPFLVIFDDEVMAYSCFSRLMERMVSNFPHGCAMDQHFGSLKHLMQVLDPKLFDVLQSNGDYADFYFCYRWLLLDFKRELAYEDVYRVWETIWSARHVATDHFVIFMALAMVRYYRDIIIENNMDFTDTIKFFNEMAERHDARRITALARDCIVELQSYIRS